MTFLSIIITILVFCVIIMLHELGHFIAAKACGIYVKEFAFGMGPAIFRKKGKETEFVIRAFPVGGFCAFEDDFDDGSPKPVEMQNPRAYNRRPVWQRIIVIISGPLMNLILGFLVVVISLCASEAMASTTIAEFRDQSVSNSTLMVNDEILSIDGLPIYSTSDITYKLQNSDRKNAEGNLIYDFVVKRNGENITLKDVEFMTIKNDDGSTGVYFDFYVYRLEKNFVNVITQGFRESLSTARIIILSLFDMITGKYGINDLSGPIGVGSVITEAVSHYTIAEFLSIVSLISINVGIFNLIPIPALDGCKLIFLLIELIIRKPVKPQIEGAVNFVGFAALFLLMIVVTFNDIVKIASGGA